MRAFKEKKPNSTDFVHLHRVGPEGTCLCDPPLAPGLARVPALFNKRLLSDVKPRQSEE